MSIIRETLIEETCKKCTETNCGMECFVYRQKCYVDEKKYKKQLKKEKKKASKYVTMDDETYLRLFHCD